MDFTAIDFETANYDRRSACAVGIAVVRDGKIVDNFSSLIRPPNSNFLKAFVKLHGITPQRVRNAPTFQDVWPEIQSKCGCGLVAAHNAAFDIGVMFACAEEYGLGHLSGNYLCTLQLARAILPGMPNHRLITLASVLGIPLDHHNAASDSLACAELAVRLMGLAGPEGIGGYCREFASFGLNHSMDAEYHDEGVIISLDKYRTQVHIGTEGNVPLVDIAPPDNRFEGKQFVFTGELIFLDRDEACEIVEAQGGKTGNSVSRKTAYLVVGEEVLDAFKRTGETTGKLARAVAVQEAGAPLRIIGASEFMNMIR